MRSGVRGSGPDGNAQLTALAGLALVAPLAAVFLTGLLFGSMRSLHFFVGFLLVPLVAVKLASTAWRVARYYIVDRRDHAYRMAGPPWWLPRALGPATAASAIVAVVSGVVLWALRTERGAWSTVHSASAVVFAVFLGLHLLIRGWDALSAGRAEIETPHIRPLPGRSLRHAVLTAALLSGIAGGAVLTAHTDWPAQPDRHPGPNARG
jgi:hypothetical protein